MAGLSRICFASPVSDNRKFPSRFQNSGINHHHRTEKKPTFKFRTEIEIKPITSEAVNKQIGRFRDLNTHLLLVTDLCETLVNFSKYGYLPISEQQATMLKAILDTDRATVVISTTSDRFSIKRLLGQELARHRNLLIVSDKNITTENLQQHENLEAVLDSANRGNLIVFGAGDMPSLDDNIWNTAYKLGGIPVLVSPKGLNFATKHLGFSFFQVDSPKGLFETILNPLAEIANQEIAIAK